MNPFKSYFPIELLKEGVTREQRMEYVHHFAKVFLSDPSIDPYFYEFYKQHMLEDIEIRAERQGKENREKFLLNQKMKENQ